MKTPPGVQRGGVGGEPDGYFIGGTGIAPGKT
jgi:hypothetical protein